MLVGSAFGIASPFRAAFRDCSPVSASLPAQLPAPLTDPPAGPAMTCFVPLPDRKRSPPLGVSVGDFHTHCAPCALLRIVGTRVSRHIGDTPSEMHPPTAWPRPGSRAPADLPPARAWPRPPAR